MKSRINLLQKLGFFLILVSFLLLLGAEIYADFNRTATRKLTEQIQSYLPERTGLYEARHWPCSGSCEQVYVKSR